MFAGGWEAAARPLEPRTRSWSFWRRADSVHALTSTVRGLAGGDLEFADLLERRLVALERLARGEVDDAVLEDLAGSNLSRSFLAEREASWNDGDENLVRGELDRWAEDDADPSRDIAGRLIAAANHVGSIRARPETVWFLLWEMEGMLADLRDLLGAPDTERSEPGSRT